MASLVDAHDAPHHPRTGKQKCVYAFVCAHVCVCERQPSQTEVATHHLTVPP